MSTNSPYKRIKQILTEIGTDLTSTLTEVEEAVWLVNRQLDEPLRAAIIGEASSGKSTLVNALVGRSIVPTGAETLTYNVNMIRHVSRSPNGREELVVHMRDNTVRQLPLSALTVLVDGRIDDNLGLRKQVLWVEVYIDDTRLINIDIIDTPGLFSAKGDDSKNTIDLMHDPHRRPDVILFLAQKEYKEADVKAVAEFQGMYSSPANKINGLNTLTALTHCDYYNDGDWSTDYNSKAMEIIDNNRRRYSAFRACFSRAFAVAPLYAQAAHILSVDDFEKLRLISQSPIAEKFFYKYNMLRYTDPRKDAEVWAQIFPTDHDKLEMVQRLELPVMKYAVWLLRQNPDIDHQHLVESLLRYSNVDEISRYIFSHHHERLNIFYKGTRLVGYLRKKIETTLHSLLDKEIATKMISALNKCKALEVMLYQEFAYLGVLRDYYNNGTCLPKSDWEMALATIQLCIDPESQADEVSTHLTYWTKRAAFYDAIYDVSAYETANILIKALKNQ